RLTRSTGLAEPSRVHAVIRLTPEPARSAPASAGAEAVAAEPRQSATRRRSERELLSKRHHRVPKCLPFRRYFVTFPENRAELGSGRLGVGELEQAIVEPVVLGVEGQRVHAQVRECIV